MRFARFSALIVLIGMAPGALSEEAKVTRALKPQDIVDHVLNKSFAAERIRIQNQLAHTDLESVLGRFDLRLNANVDYEYSESEDLSGLANPIDKTLRSGLSLSKPTRFGTIFTLGYEHIAQSSVLNPIITTREDRAALDRGYFQIRQPLWNNALGVSDRLDLREKKQWVSEADLEKQENTENLVLRALELYWSAYTAQTKLKDALAAREMYQSLIKVVQRRGRFGLDKGGEYAQVMADATDAETAVKNASYEYLNQLRELEILMNEEFKGDVRFEVEPLIPPIPKTEPVEIEKLRPLQIAKSRLDRAELARRSMDFKLSPSLELVAKASSTGVEADAGRSYSEFVAGNKPDYFIGLQFETALDSSQKRAGTAYARLNKSQREVDLRELELRLKSELELLRLQVEQTHASALSATEAEKFRTRTIKEQEVEYRQGRLPLRELLQTYSKYFESQTKKIEAIGAHHIARNRFAALRDELVR